MGLLQLKSWLASPLFLGLLDLIAAKQNTPGGLYLQVPRGSNNRLQERTANVAEDQRLFLSNNNKRGGYNVGEKTTDEDGSPDQADQYNMRYFMSNTPDEGASFLNVEWSQLAACGVDEDGDKIQDCNLKIQYMCQDDLEDADSVNNLEDMVTIRNGFGRGTGKSTFTYEHSKLPDPQGDCYRDDHNRDLASRHTIPTPSRRETKEDGEQETSIEWCIRTCREEDFIYAGVQNTNACYCGNSYGRFGKIPQSECDSTCGGNPNLRCGGTLANNIYLSGNFDRNSDEDRGERLSRRESSIEPDHGVHESWEYYDRCDTHIPNTGVDFEQRSGYECHTERQTIDYNRANPWTDVAIFSDDSFRCPMYRSTLWEPAFECVQFYNNGMRRHKSVFLTEEDCTANGHDWLGFYNYMSLASQTYGLIQTQEQCEELQGTDGFMFTWGRPLNWIDISNDILSEEQCLILPPLPSCEDIKNTNSGPVSNEPDADTDTYTNPIDGNEDPNQFPRFRWRLPSFPKGDVANQRCILRIRQFISVPNEDVIDLSNRSVDLNGDPLYLALPQWQTRENTVVFEDRSHVFILAHRPENMDPDLTIHNLAVRGKRGNIVQTFPAVEYDFSPNRLRIDNGDAIHMQWTGSNTHDNEGGGDGQNQDDGEGRGGTDRHNFMQMLNFKENFPMPYEVSTFFKTMVEVAWSPVNLGNTIEERRYNAELAHSSGGYYWCLDADTCGARSYEARTKIQERYNNVSPSFPGMVFIPANNQEIFYMCLRNSNFSNRSQKGRLRVGRQANWNRVEGFPVPVNDPDLESICGKPIYVPSRDLGRNEL